VSDNLRQFAFGFVLLVLGAGLEELLPKFLGVGFPVLLAAVQARSVGGGLPMVLVLAVVAGALEDALSSLPFLASVGFFILAALAVRRVGWPRLAIVLTYPCYQVWLALWTSGAGAGIFGRLLLSLPIGGLTACVVGTGIAWLGRRGAVDERD